MSERYTDYVIKMNRRSSLNYFNSSLWNACIALLFINRMVDMMVDMSFYDDGSVAESSSFNSFFFDKNTTLACYGSF